MSLVIIVSLIIAIAISPILLIEIQAGTFFNGTNFTNVNYTNIYINKTYMDLIVANRGETIPARDLDFGIAISNTCYKIHQYTVNSKSKCPTYEAIMAIFPDTSNQKVSGKFIMKHNQLQRGVPQMESHYNWYDFKKNTTLLFIDPDHETKKQLAMITIEAHLPAFPKNMSAYDNVRTMGIGRSIDSCRNVVIGAENWIFLVGDSMELIRHDCHPTYTLYEDEYSIFPNLTKHDIATTNKYLHDTFLEWVKENCLFEYDKC